MPVQRHHAARTLHLLHAILLQDAHGAAAKQYASLRRRAALCAQARAADGRMVRAALFIAFHLIRGIRQEHALSVRVVLRPVA